MQPLKNISHGSNCFEFEWNYKPKEVNPCSLINNLTVTEQRDYIIDLQEHIYFEHLKLFEHKFKKTDEFNREKIIQFVLGRLDSVFSEAADMLTESADKLKHLNSAKSTDKLRHPKEKEICKGDNFFHYVRTGMLKVANDLAGEINQADYLERLDSYSKFKVNYDDSIQSIQETQSCAFNEIQKHKIKGHFYRIENADGIVRGYLLGTVHHMHSCIKDMNKEIQLAISQADRLFLEIKELDLCAAHMEKRTEQFLRSQSEENLQKALQVYINIFKSHSLCLDGTTWEELEKKLAQLPSPDALKLCFQQYNYVCEYKKGIIYDSEAMIHPGIDGWLFNQFTNAKKSIHGLESAEAHFQLCDELCLKDQGIADGIMGMLEPNLEAAEETAFSRCKWWAKGDIPKLESNKPGSLKYRQSEERSQHFANIIYKDLKENLGLGLYGCGAAHLYDGNGVIKTLLSLGMRVIRVE